MGGACSKKENEEKPHSLRKSTEIKETDDSQKDEDLDDITKEKH